MLTRTPLPNRHTQTCKADYTRVPPFKSKGKDLKMLIDYYSSYDNNSNLFGNAVLSSHTISEPRILRPQPSQYPGRRTHLIQAYEARDTFNHIYGMCNPSSLSQPALVNDRYDCSVFEGEKAGEAAMGGLYESLKDPVEGNTRPEAKTFVREMVVRSECDHEWSLHNQLLKNTRKTGLAVDPLELPNMLPFYSSKRQLLGGLKDITY
eukprot:TRINITY_DN9207_c0_g2_i1.p1 TRINITY_DN9207_c0_g2~~TRINITY_DN9207_c0_g2_i1.p1  ORF type:complete len:207 (+),score=33.96 TRINITY_DN9207_c0_g2_i1:56-676(+)